MKVNIVYFKHWLMISLFCLGVVVAELAKVRSVSAETVQTVENADQEQTKAKALYEQAIQLMVDSKKAKANQQSILSLLTQSADLNYTRAQVDLGKIYYFGLTGKQDDVIALEWFKKAAEQGDAHGQYLLGQMYTEGKGGLKESEQMAVEWYEKSANQGYAPAQYYLAILYLTGIDGIEKDQDKAFELLKKAADQGYQDAVNLLSKMQPQ